MQQARTHKLQLSSPTVYSLYCGPAVYSYTGLLATGEGKTLKAEKRKRNFGRGKRVKSGKRMKDGKKSTICTIYTRYIIWLRIDKILKSLKEKDTVLTEYLKYVFQIWCFSL